MTVVNQRLDLTVFAVTVCELEGDYSGCIKGFFLLMRSLDVRCSRAHHSGSYRRKFEAVHIYTVAAFC